MEILKKSCKILLTKLDGSVIDGPEGNLQITETENFLTVGCGNRIPEFSDITWTFTTHNESRGELEVDFWYEANRFKIGFKTLLENELVVGFDFKKPTTPFQNMNVSRRSIGGKCEKVKLCNSQ